MLRASTASLSLSNPQVFHATICLSAICFVAIGTTIGALGLFLLPIVAETGWSAFKVSTIPSAFLLGKLIAAPPVGWALDRTSPRLVICAGGVLAAAGYALAALVGSYPVMLASFAAAGFGTGAATYVSATYLIGTLTPRPAVPIGIIIGVSSAGAAICPPVIGHLITEPGWRDTLTLIAVSLAVVLPLAVALPNVSRSGAEQLQDVEGKGGRRATHLHLLAIYGAGFLAQLGFMGIYIHFVPFLVGAGFAEDKADDWLGIVNAISAAGLVATGALSNRFGSIVVLSALLAVHSAVLLLVAGSAHWQLLLLFPFLFGLWGLVQGADSQLMPVIVLENFQRGRFGRLSGGLFFTKGLGAVGGPLLAGALLDQFGQYEPAFIVSAFLLLGSILLLRPLSRATTLYAERPGRAA